jgi:hypothetical protein
MVFIQDDGIETYGDLKKVLWSGKATLLDFIRLKFPVCIIIHKTEFNNPPIKVGLFFTKWW